MTSYQEQRREAQEAESRRQRIAKLMAEHRYQEQRAKRDEWSRMTAAENAKIAARDAEDEAQERAVVAAREERFRRSIEAKATAKAIDHERRVAALVGRTPSDHAQRMAELNARLAGAPARSTSAPAPTSTRQFGPVLVRLGLSASSRAEIATRLAGMKTDDVLRLGDGSELSIGSGGALHVHRGSPVKSAPTAVRHVEFRASESADGQTLEGYAAVFNQWTDITDAQGTYRERIAPGAFKRSLSERTPVLQFDHGSHPLIGSVPLGTITEIREDSNGLFVKARLSDNWLVQPIRDAIRDKAISGMSFRFRVIDDEWGADARGEIRTVKDVDLPELGPVVFPAYQQTSVSVRGN